MFCKRCPPSSTIIVPPPLLSDNKAGECNNKRLVGVRAVVMVSKDPLTSPAGVHALHIRHQTAVVVHLPEGHSSPVQLLRYYRTGSFKCASHSCDEESLTRTLITSRHCSILVRGALGGSYHGDYKT